MNQSSAKERPCPDCGEMVRENSLRCWNCGAFMNPELEKKFMAMQANPAPIIYSEMPADEATSLDDVQGDDDFELSVPMTRPEPAESAAPAGEAKTESTQADAPAAAPAAEAASPARGSDDESAVPHSVATGGDALLDIAIQEERDRRKRQKIRKPAGGMVAPGGGLIIFCPYGCRVVVKEQHRGMTGKCPRCEAPFIVPVDPPQYRKKDQEADAGGGAADFFKAWVAELRLHIVPPEKLKLKADSLLKDFVPADAGMAPDILLVAVLAKRKTGGLASKSDKPDDLREAVQQHFHEGKTFADLPLDTKLSYSPGDLSQLKIVQPAASRADSIFHGIPVFGEGRIAVQLPFTSETIDPSYLSMGITQFREFAKGLAEVYGVTGFGDDAGIPMSDQLSTYQCHFSESLIKALGNVEFYKADPMVELEIAGWQCGACKTTVSEAARKKESLGGKTPKGIAKAKCPKCGSKMGEHPLYSRKADVSEPSMSGG